MPANLPLSALLAYVEEEAHNWERWFRENPTAAETKIDVRRMLVPPGRGSLAAK